MSDPLIVRPGDVLVVCVDRHMDEVQLERLRTELSQIGTGIKIAVIEGVIQLAAYRPSREFSELVEVMP